MKKKTKILSDLEIAKEVVRLTEAHRSSWSAVKLRYGKVSWWYDNIEPFLLTQPQSTFGKFALMFAHNYCQDLLQICEEIIKEQDTK